jgi:hypothetical protein
MAQDAALNGRIGDFAGLVGLVLALLTLFTSQRQDARNKLSSAAGLDRGDFTREIVLDVALVCVTVLLFLAGLPLCGDTLADVHPLRDYGPLRAAFLIVWLLLLPCLIIWQATIGFSVKGLRDDWDEEHAED